MKLKNMPVEGGNSHSVWGCPQLNHKDETKLPPVEGGNFHSVWGCLQLNGKAEHFSIHILSSSSFKTPSLTTGE